MISLFVGVSQSVKSKLTFILVNVSSFRGLTNLSFLRIPISSSRVDFNQYPQSHNFPFAGTFLKNLVFCTWKTYHLKKRSRRGTFYQVKSERGKTKTQKWLPRAICLLKEKSSKLFDRPGLRNKIYLILNGGSTVIHKNTSQGRTDFPLCSYWVF